MVTGLFTVFGNLDGWKLCLMHLDGVCGKIMPEERELGCHCPLKPLPHQLHTAGWEPCTTRSINHEKSKVHGASAQTTAIHGRMSTSPAVASPCRKPLCMSHQRCTHDSSTFATATETATTNEAHHSGSRRPQRCVGTMSGSYNTCSGCYAHA